MRKLYYLFLLCAINSVIVQHVIANSKPPKPNIILILIDDQDLDEKSVYGGKVYTPNIDQLASEGIKFTKAYVS